jgi:acyl-CoA reductase-like NAD-dependent aldehyde dehydrogenase
MYDDVSFQCLVDGTCTGEAVKEILNPATGQPVARTAIADAAMLDDAVTSARKAFRLWRTTALSTRRALLARIADLVHDHASDLARLITLEQGKPLQESRQEVAFSESIFRMYADMRPNDSRSLFFAEGERFYQNFTPLGVVAGIIPWNFPLLIAAMKVAPAILAGNAIIVKPAPTTPLTTLYFAARLANDLPAGLIQVLADDGSLGPLMTGHAGIDKIAFTGSTASGRSVMAASAATLKRQTLELGGNDPAIVLNDADVPKTAERIFAAAYTNAGQVCGAVKRLYVQRDAYVPLCEHLAQLVRAAVLGDGLHPETTIGPVQNRRQYDRACALLESASRAGRTLARGAAHDGPGYFVPPVLIADLPETHALISEEQFAPLLPVLPFDTIEEALVNANASAFGLTASVWSRDTSKAEAVALELDAALVCVNRHNENPVGLGVSMAKQSGIGWLLGEEGVKEYLQPHLVIR